MKLTIERAALLKALGHVQSVVERRNTVPILSNVLLSAERNAVGLSATDLDMEIVDETPAPVEGTGQITAPAHTLYEIVRKLPEGAEVALNYTGEDPRLTVQAGRSRFNLPVLPAGDFPVMSADGLSAADRHRHRRPDPPDRQDPFRHLHRRDALLPERPLSACGGRGRPAAAARRGHRRPPPGAGRDAGAGRLGRNAGRDHSAQDHWRGFAACWTTPARWSRCSSAPRR